jgi:hypothetical protein
MSETQAEPTTVAPSPTIASPPPPAAPAPAPDWMSRLQADLLRRLLIVGALSVLVMIGLFLTNFSRLRALYYWSAMFPVFGLVCLWHELLGSSPEAGPSWKIILRQVLHWLGPIVAVQIIFLQLERGQMDADAVALVTLVILAVTCFLAGVHMDRTFFWVSIALALAAVIGTEVEAYIWMIAALAVVALAITVFAATALRRHATQPGHVAG